MFQSKIQHPLVVWSMLHGIDVIENEWDDQMLSHFVGISQFYSFIIYYRTRLSMIWWIDCQRFICKMLFKNHFSSVSGIYIVIYNALISYHKRVSFGSVCYNLPLPDDNISAWAFNQNALNLNLNLPRKEQN